MSEVDSPADSSAVVAASVAYRRIETVPEGLDDFVPPEGTCVRYYELTSLDGRTGLAAYVAGEKPDHTAPLVISVHGSGGDIGSQPVRGLALGLPAAGFPVLAINTRQSGDAVNTDNFYATVRDIEAAYWMARSLGHERIVLHGHSLGTSQVTLFAATHWHETTLGVVLTGMFADLPWKSRHLLIDDEARYRALTEEAVEAVRAGDYGRTLSAGMPWLGGRTMPVTAGHFLTYRRVGIAGARSVEWIARIPYPLLMIRDEHDQIIHDFEPGCLEAAAAEGLSPSVTMVTLSSVPPTDGHRFEGSRKSLLDTVSGWLTTVSEEFARS
jgi:pimeloyl-ACP methyl ester carboxylesterase